MALPTNIDASYPDRDAGDALHQQHHDTVHGILNDPATYWTAGNAAYAPIAGGTGLLKIVDAATGTAATDTAAINAAITAAKAAPFYSGVALRKTGTAYAVNATVALDGAGLAFTSVGGRAVINRSADGFGPVLKATAADVSIFNVEITGPAVGAVIGDYGVQAVGTTRLRVENVRVSGQGDDGISLNTTANLYATIRDNEVTGCFGHGITATAGSDDAIFVGNRVHDQLTGAYGYVIGYTGADTSRVTFSDNFAETVGAAGGYQLNRLVDSTISGNIAKDTKTGFAFVDCEDCSISGNVANDTTPDAAHTSAFYFDTRRCTIVGNTTDAITGTGDGFRFIAGSTDNLVVSNKTRAATREGFMVEGIRNTFIGNHAEGATNRGFRVRASNNTLLSNRVEGNAISGIKLENTCNAVTVAHNDVSNVAAAGTNPPGIHLDTTPTNTRIFGNIVHDIGTGTAILDSSASASIGENFESGTWRHRAGIELDGALDHDGTTVGFYGVAPVARQTLPAAGVVTADDIRAALINLGLCQ